jgi:hypothetical protein
VCDVHRDIVVQTNMFLDRLFNDSQVDPANDWKLLTIMIGDSDICKSCHDFVSTTSISVYIVTMVTDGVVAREPVISASSNVCM